MTNKNLFTWHALLTGIPVIFSSLLLGCGSDAETGKATRAKNPAQLVELATVVTRPVAHSSQRTGTLRPRKTVRVFNQEEGSLTDIPYYEGDKVRRGDVLLRIDDKLLRAQFDKANATLQQAQQDMKRLLKLRKKRLVAEDEVTRARTALDVADAEQRLLKTRLGYTVITSPMDAVVSERLAEPGDIAPRHSHLLTLIDTGTLITEVSVSGLLIPVLNIGDNVEVHIDALANQSFSGTIKRIHPTLNPSTRNGIVEIILDPVPEGATPGQFCRVTLISKSIPRKLIPFSALRQDAEGSYVYLLSTNNKVSRKTVQTGLRFTDQVEIIAGLNDGQRVVVKGFLGLKDGKTVRTIDSKPEQVGL